MRTERCRMFISLGWTLYNTRSTFAKQDAIAQARAPDAPLQPVVVVWGARCQNDKYITFSISLSLSRCADVSESNKSLTRRDTQKKPNPETIMTPPRINIYVVPNEGTRTKKKERNHRSHFICTLSLGVPRHARSLGWGEGEASQRDLITTMKLSPAERKCAICATTCPLYSALVVDKEKT